MLTLETLQQNEFRLLQLQPSSDLTSQIKATLNRVSFDSAPEYDAISYVWGDASQKVPIVVNETEVLVTPNLRAALYQLRQPKETRTLWVDALCINQADTVERGHQVKYMGDVYRRANCVCMWIGEAYDNTDAALRLLRACLEPLEFRFSANSCLPPSHATERYSIKIGYTGTRRQRLAQALIDDQEGCSALTNLLSRPYWRRMWVFQEVILARQPLVHCGPHIISWKAFQYLDVIAEDPHVWLPLQSKYPWIRSLRRALFDASHLFMSATEAGIPDNVLQPTRHLESSDPRDKIYALMGVWSKSPDRLLHQGLFEETSIDYSKPVREVYTDFTNCMIQSRNNLSPLLTAGLWQPAHGPDLGIPSWVPDLRGARGIDIRFLASYHLKYFNASDGVYCHYSTPRSPPWSPDMNLMLDVQGVMVDCIRRKVEDTRDATLAEIASLDSTQGHPSGLSQLQVFFSTMIFQHRDFLSGNNAEEQDANREWMKRLLFGFCWELECFDSEERGPRIPFNIAAFLDSFQFPQLEQIGGEAGISLSSEYDSFCDQETAIEYFRTEYLYRCGHKAADVPSSFFFTNDNQMGIGPEGCQPGDILVVLRGCPTPLVLRKAEPDDMSKGPWTSRTYQVVGPCYIFGIMNGEAFKEDAVIENMYLV